MRSGRRAYIAYKSGFCSVFSFGKGCATVTAVGGSLFCLSPRKKLSEKSALYLQVGNILYFWGKEFIE
ncbi:MAG: hypothetical protein HYY40_09165 [Bacteroidetes bacterium]|nr:hypothetical protein [Bacteroidota bacterium]